MSDASYWMSKALELESKLQTTRTNFEKVMEFHNAFGQDTPPYMSLDISQSSEAIDKLLQLRATLIGEESKEVLAELDNGNPDLARIAKELADLLYVTYGCADMLGIPLDDVFDEVHRSNMSKLDENGNPVFREDGKILKSPLYKEADVKGVLDRFRQRSNP